MPAIKYRSLGSISGETTNTQAPFSKRGRDRDAAQAFIFECDEADPITAIAHIQGSVDEPPLTRSRQDPFPPSGENLTWADLVELDFVDEGGEIFVQIEAEVAQVRVVVKPGNYTSGKIKKILTMI